MTRRPPPPASFADGGPLAAFGLLLAGLCSRALRRPGVDVAALRTLVVLEFVLAARRARQAKADGTVSARGTGIGFALLSNFLVGGLGAIAIVESADPLWSIAVAQFVLMMFVIMTVVGDHLPGLVETGTVDVIAATPVGDRTMVAARIIHVTASLSLTVLALSMLPMVAGAHRFGIWFAPLYLVTSGLAVATCLGLACGVFLLAIRLLDPERFRDALLYLQIGAMVSFVAAWQLLPGLMGGSLVEVGGDRRDWWLALLPPFHGAGLLAFVIGDRGGLTAVLACLAVLVPFLSLVVLATLGSHGFVARLSALATAARGAPDVRPRRRPVRDLLLRSKTARAAYDFVVALSRRERQFRMLTYPMIAVAAVMGGVIAFRSGGLAEPALLCGAIYFLGLQAPALVAQARYSENPDARWLFQVAPLATPGDLLAGGMTALLATFVLPAGALMVVLVVAIGGPGIILDAVFALEAVVLAAVVAVLALGRFIPFTEPRPPGAREANVGLAVAMLTLTGLLVGAHALLRTTTFGFALALLIQPFAAWLLWDGVRLLRPRAPWLTAR